MAQIPDDVLIRALGRQMNMAVARQVVSASNLANIDTPGYRTREVEFENVLAQEVGKMALGTTSPSQISGPGAAGAPKVRETEGLQARRDGNNVQLDRELLQMTKAAGDFSAAQTALTAKFRLIRYAINEGR
jgi:flagellar basal-body rod protein FlgB